MKISTDFIFKKACRLCAFAVPIFISAFFVQLAVSSSEAWKVFGLDFIVSGEWNPVSEKFGALNAIIGTLITTLIALSASLPLAFALALFIADAPEIMAKPLAHAIDLLASIPSVIYGMWGLFVICPIMQNIVQPFLIETLHFGKIPFFGTQGNGFGFLTAGLILAVMVLPYICAVMRDVFKMTPPMLREAAFGIGCTRFEAAKDIVVKYGKKGILGGIFIGLGRALGETMAVLFVIGNFMGPPASLMGSGTTIASTIANNFAEADGLHKSALFALGLILLAMSLLIQAVSQYCLNKTDANSN